MAKYKLLKGGYATWGFKKNQIYDEKIKSFGNSVKWFVDIKPNDWELVEEEFVLPEFWQIKRDINNYQVINDWMNQHHNRLVGETQSYNDKLGNVNNKSLWKGVKSDLPEITFEQFKKYVLKENNSKMEKEIIGYKLKDDSMRKAASLIANGHTTGMNLFYGYNMIANSSAVRAIEKAGVLDLWFEPIYATQTPQITINGYKAEFFDNYVEFGCATIAKEFILKIHDILSNKHWEKSGHKNIEAVTIGRGVFTKDQIKEIAEFYNKK